MNATGSCSSALKLTMRYVAQCATVEIKPLWSPVPSNYYLRVKEHACSLLLSTFPQKSSIVVLHFLRLASNEQFPVITLVVMRMGFIVWFSNLFVHLKSIYGHKFRGMTQSLRSSIIAFCFFRFSSKLMAIPAYTIISNFTCVHLFNFRSLHFKLINNLPTGLQNNFQLWSVAAKTIKI